VGGREIDIQAGCRLDRLDQPQPEVWVLAVTVGAPDPFSSIVGGFPMLGRAGTRAADGNGSCPDVPFAVRTELLHDVNPQVPARLLESQVIEMEQLRRLTVRPRG
jgi:hypothetical protein